MMTSTSSKVAPATLDREKGRIELCSAILRDLLGLYENLEQRHKRATTEDEEKALLKMEVGSYRKAIKNIQTVVQELESVESAMILASKLEEKSGKSALEEELENIQSKTDYKNILEKAKDFEEKMEDIIRQSDPMKTEDSSRSGTISNEKKPSKMHGHVKELTELCQKISTRAQVLVDNTGSSNSLDSDNKTSSKKKTVDHKENMPPASTIKDTSLSTSINPKKFSTVQTARRSLPFPGGSIISKEEKESILKTENDMPVGSETQEKNKKPILTSSFSIILNDTVLLKDKASKSESKAQSSKNIQQASMSIPADPADELPEKEKMPKEALGKGSTSSNKESMRKVQKAPRETTLDSTDQLSETDKIMDDDLAGAYPSTSKEPMRKVQKAIRSTPFPCPPDAKPVANKNSFTCGSETKKDSTKKVQKGIRSTPFPSDFELLDDDTIAESAGSKVKESTRKVQTAIRSTPFPANLNEANPIEVSSVSNENTGTKVRKTKQPPSFNRSESTSPDSDDDLVKKIQQVVNSTPFPRYFESKRLENRKFRELAGLKKAKDSKREVQTALKTFPFPCPPDVTPMEKEKAIEQFVSQAKKETIRKLCQAAKWTQFFGVSAKESPLFERKKEAVRKIHKPTRPSLFGPPDANSLNTDNVIVQTSECEAQTTEIDNPIFLSVRGDYIPIDGRFRLVPELERQRLGPYGVLPLPYHQFLPHIPLAPPLFHSLTPYSESLNPSETNPERKNDEPHL